MSGVLIVDVDDTLFDWLSMWRHSFESLFSEVFRNSKHSRNELSACFRELHQQAGTTERGISPGDATFLGIPTAIVEQTVQSFLAAGYGLTHPYDGVLETLETLKQRGFTIIAHTDTPLAISGDRLCKLGLDGNIHTLFALPVAGMQFHRPELETPLVTKCVELGAKKPHPSALKQILSDLGAAPEEAVYVGDSKMKDLPMARAVGVRDIHAEYGCNRDGGAYDRLREVSHTLRRRHCIRKVTAISDTQRDAQQFSRTPEFDLASSAHDLKCPGV